MKSPASPGEIDTLPNRNVPDGQGPTFCSYLNEEGTLVGVQSDITDNPQRQQDGGKKKTKSEGEEVVELRCGASHIGKEVIHKK